jgi:hypothetical protein
MVMEKYKGDNFLCFTFPMSNFLIAGNVGYASSAAKLSASPPRPPSAAPNTVATIDRSKEQDGSEIRIVNSGTYPVVFSKADPTFQLPADVKLSPGGSATFHYNGRIGKFTLK